MPETDSTQPKVDDLLNDRSAVAAELKQMGDLLKEDEGRDFTPEEEDKWSDLQEQYEGLTKKIDRQQKIEAADLASRAARLEPVAKKMQAMQRRQREVFDRREDRGGKPTLEERMIAMHAWAKYGRNFEPTEAEVRAAERCGVKIDSEYHVFDVGVNRRGLSDRGWEHRVLTEDSSGTQADDVVPQGFSGEFFNAMTTWGGMRQACRTVNIPGANPVMWPLVDDLGNTGSIVADESTGHGTSDPTFSELQFDAYRYSSDMVRVSRTLMMHSAFDFSSMLAELLGVRIGRAQNAHFTDGTGASQPQGAFETGAVSAQFDRGTDTNLSGADTVTIAVLLKLQHEVVQPYRNQNSAWMAHDTFISLIRQLTTGTGGDLVWQDNLRIGQPAQLSGYPIIANNDMTPVGTTGVGTAAPAAIAFGDFSKYVIRDSGQLALKRSDDRYFELDQVAFVGIYLSDGNPLRTTNASPVKWLGNPT